MKKWKWKSVLFSDIIILKNDMIVFFKCWAYCRYGDAISVQQKTIYMTIRNRVSSWKIICLCFFRWQCQEDWFDVRVAKWWCDKMAEFCIARFSFSSSDCVCVCACGPLWATPRVTRFCALMRFDCCSSRPGGVETCKQGLILRRRQWRGRHCPNCLAALASVA